MSLLEVKDLSVVYPGGGRAVREVNLVVEAGECVGLVGESGSGKTSVVLALLGLLSPRTVTTGSVRLAGEELVGCAPGRWRALRGTHLGFVPQDPFAACDPLRPVADHVAEAWRAKGQRLAPGAVAGALAEVGIEADQGRLRPHQWSGGMLQRATIAAATAHHPALTIADEPTSALDAARREEILTVLRRRSSALLLVSHDLGLVARHADRVAVLYGGRVVETGPTAVVANRPRHPFTIALLAAVPRRGAPLPASLAGDAPDPRRDDVGCAFAPRCPRALPQCFRHLPALVDGVACPVAVHE